MAPRDLSPLQAAAERIVMRYLRRGTVREVQQVGPYDLQAAHGVDLMLTTGAGEHRAIKVKADPYFGTDAAKIDDRSLSYYRADTGDLAFESLASSTTQAPGWMIESQADDLYYYYLALAQEPEEIAALLRESDPIFFSELLVERDELVVLPMQATRSWFAQHAEAYPPRPVFTGAGPSWYRLIPREDVTASIPGVRIIGGIFQSAAM